MPGYIKGRVHNRTSEPYHRPHPAPDSSVQFLLVTVPTVRWNGYHPHVHTQLEYVTTIIHNNHLFAAVYSIVCFLESFTNAQLWRDALVQNAWDTGIIMQCWDIHSINADI